MGKARTFVRMILQLVQVIFQVIFDGHQVIKCEHFAFVGLIKLLDNVFYGLFDQVHAGISLLLRTKKNEAVGSTSIQSDEMVLVAKPFGSLQLASLC
jgi:hypothetical protein